MVEINSHSIRSRVITCIKETPFLIYKFGGNGASTMACQELQYCMWTYMCCISKYLWAKTYTCGLKKYLCAKKNICGHKNIFVDIKYICGHKNIFVF